MRLIKSNMSVLSYSQNLNIRSAQKVDQFIIHFTAGIDICCHAIRNKGQVRIDIDLAEKIAVHVVAVALFIRTRQTAILVQIYRCNLGKIQSLLPVLTHQLPIHSQRRRTGSQTQYRIRHQPNLCRHQTGRIQTHSFIIFDSNNFNHNQPPSN